MLVHATRSTRHQGTGRFPLCALLCLGALLSVAGCSTHVSAKRVSSRESYLASTSSALTSDQYSSVTRLVLHRYGLDAQFEDSPVEALESLHQKACTDDRRDLLLALAELNYLFAGQKLREVRPWAPKNARDYYLSSAIYAYLYLFDVKRDVAQDEFDPGFRLACDIYNQALPKSFANPNLTNGAVLLESGPRKLLPGTVDIRFDHSGFPLDLQQINRFLPVDDYIVRGLTARNREFGLGSPLIGVETAPENTVVTRSVPATIFLRIESGGAKHWSANQIAASLELYSPYNTRTTDVAGRKIPLETDTTAPLAHMLSSDQLWAVGRAQFFSSVEKIKSRIYSRQPHRAGRIPVVFIHGTFSSPVWWAEMWNTLEADPVLAGRFEFWNYIYNSGNSVAYSAAHFRDSLTNYVGQLDPGQQDAAMRQMVLIGHSQGGLLAKMAVTDPGDKLWHSMTDRNFDSLNLTSEQHDLIEKTLFFKPLPFVKRVIFISTPHRGSFRITLFLVRTASRLIALPLDTVHAMSGFLRLNDDLRLPHEFRHGVPNSLDSMSPRNNVQLTLAEIPPVAGVKCHSIIAVKGRRDPKHGNDGIVKYQSAHIDYAESEFIVRSRHSCQSNPATIEEVRRILLEHLRSLETGI